MAARKPDIQYITQFYVHGSEARVLELKPARKQSRTVLPKAAPESKKEISLKVDPVACCALVVAFVMLVVMIVGVVQYLDICEEHRLMQDYVVRLQNSNVELRQTYEAGYDIAEIETMALALGMVHLEDAETTVIHPVVPTAEPEPTWWENICWRFEQLFA